MSLWRTAGVTTPARLTLTFFHCVFTPDSLKTPAQDAKNAQISTDHHKAYPAGTTFPIRLPGWFNDGAKERHKGSDAEVVSRERCSWGCISVQSGSGWAASVTSRCWCSQPAPGAEREFCSKLNVRRRKRSSKLLQRTPRKLLLLSTALFAAPGRYWVTGQLCFPLIVLMLWGCHERISHEQMVW